MGQRTFGLDFGTTNSLVAYIDEHERRCVVLTDVSDSRPHPSAVRYRGDEVIVGREARKHLDAGVSAVTGDFVRSPKRLLLGDAAITVGGREMEPSDVIASVLGFLKDDAKLIERGKGAVDVDRAVITIPVELDGGGRRRLRRAARKAGISVVQFVHEPLAALYGYLRALPDYKRKIVELEGQRLLVFDWGGGTLDLTLCLVQAGRLMQIASRGDNDVGGDGFDEALRNHIRDKHSREHGLENALSLENDGSAALLVNACERAKIQLSTRESTPIVIRGFLRSEQGADLALSITREELETVVQGLVRGGLSQIDQLLTDAGLETNDVAMCLPTGGMVQMPIVREGLLQRFGARAKKLANGDSVIAEGAAWIAHDGLRLALSKPIELRQPDGSYATVVGEGLALPVENETVRIDQRMYYCVDPRDGLAHFQFVRPKRPGYSGKRSERLVYGTASLRVDAKAPPLRERLEALISVDSDYVVSIQLRSKGRGDTVLLEIHDLEFSLTLPTGDGVLTVSAPDDHAQRGTVMAGGVQLRSNVTEEHDALHHVPGDLLAEYKPQAFDVRANLVTKEQREEKSYYEPCATCRRTSFECERDGCDHPRCHTLFERWTASGARVSAATTHANSADASPGQT